MGSFMMNKRPGVKANTMNYLARLLVSVLEETNRKARLNEHRA